MCEQWRIIFLQSTAKREVSASVSRSRIDQAPPEPRARGPRSERDVANDVVFGVAAPEMEVLIRFDQIWWGCFWFCLTCGWGSCCGFALQSRSTRHGGHSKKPASDWPGDWLRIVHRFVGAGRWSLSSICLWSCLEKVEAGAEFEWKTSTLVLHLSLHRTVQNQEPTWTNWNWMR